MTYDEFRKGLKLPAAAEQNARLYTIPFINEVEKTLGKKIRVSSTVRDAAHNAEVNGVANSKHLDTRALAADFVPVAYSKEILDAVRRIAAKHGFGFLIHDKGSGNHIHCEFRGGVSEKKTTARA